MFYIIVFSNVAATSSSASFPWSSSSVTNCSTRRFTCRAPSRPPRPQRNCPHLTCPQHASDLYPPSDFYQDSYFCSGWESRADRKTMRFASSEFESVCRCFSVGWIRQVSIVIGRCSRLDTQGHDSLCDFCFFLDYFCTHDVPFGWFVETAQRPQHAHFLWTGPPSSFRPCSFCLDSFYLFMAFFLILCNDFFCLVWPRQMIMCISVNTKLYDMLKLMKGPQLPPMVHFSAMKTELDWKTIKLKSIFMQGMFLDLKCYLLDFLKLITLLTRHHLKGIVQPKIKIISFILLSVEHTNRDFAECSCCSSHYILLLYEKELCKRFVFHRRTTFGITWDWINDDRI